jgi:hypothetical protein
MSELLKKLNKATLIEKLDGNDDRFTKIQTAADNVAKLLKKDPPQLIRAILAGLDPEITDDDPAINIAADALAEVWTSVRSIYTDPPILIYRFILLDACDQLAEKVNSVILWNTAADTLPLMQLGQEESIIRELLIKWANKAEDYSLIVPNISENKRAPTYKKIKSLEFKKAKGFTVKRQVLKKNIAAAVGPSNPDFDSLSDANPQWSNAASAWAYVFTDRMTELLADRVDSIYDNTAKSYNEFLEQFDELSKQQQEALKEQLNVQRTWIKCIIKENEKSSKAEHLRLNTLWWSEALYSPSLSCSYRSLTPIVSSIVMAIDLLTEVEFPTPASVGYTLSETANKLPEMSFTQEYEILDIANQLKEHRSKLQAVLGDSIIVPPNIGRLSIRDLIFSILLNTEDDAEELITRAALRRNFKISLPSLAQTIFRQEQAVLLAES